MDLKTHMFIYFSITYLSIDLMANDEPIKGRKHITIANITSDAFNKVNLPTYRCPENEEYRLCGSCANYCTKDTSVCIEPCKKGCFCKNNLIRDKNGRCVENEECWKSNRDKFNHDLHKTDVTEVPIKFHISCGDHQVYSSCRRCDKTCTAPNPVCNNSCIAGCFCEEGYLKGPDGRCILLKDCPKAEVTIGNNEPTIDECQPDEVFVMCGWCEASCSEPIPQCPETTCTRGCLCRPSLLRHSTGHCVEAKDCLPKKCLDPNEEYSCRYGCEASCIIHTCMRQSRCRLGCHCKHGLLRNSKGKCVTPKECVENIIKTMLKI